MKRLRFLAPIAGGLVAVLMVVLGVAYASGRLPGSNPRSPANIRQSATFSMLVPADKTIALREWRSSKEAVTYKATVNGQTVVVTLQPVPLQYRNDEAAYERFIGSLKPFAVFKVNIGRVALINLVEESSFAPNGQSAVVNAKGTLLIARPESGTMSQNDWATFFDTLQAE